VDRNREEPTQALRNGCDCDVYRPVSREQLAYSIVGGTVAGTRARRPSKKAMQILTAGCYSYQLFHRPRYSTVVEKDKILQTPTF